jgi:hypothetical protein
MKKVDFIKHMRKCRDTRILSNAAKYEPDYEDMIGLKKLSASLDFGCRFDKNGKCNSNPEWVDNHPACCCRDCFRSAGYLDTVLEEDIVKYSRKFSIKTGFWRKGKGCILPRKMRSAVCVAFSCKHIEGKSTYQNLLDVFEHRLQRDHSINPNIAKRVTV